MARNLCNALGAAHASVGQALDHLTEARIEAGTGDPDAARRYLNRASAMLQQAAREILGAQQLADAPRRARELDTLPTLETLLKEIARAGAGVR